MGFKDVRFAGGGILEQGKDILMWREELPRKRVNYNVVAKAEAVTGGTKIGTVLTQIQQSLGREFTDPMTHETQKVHHCYVVSSYGIKKEGTHSLGSLLAESNLTRSVTMIDGVELASLANEYLSSRSALNQFRDAFKKLAGEAVGHQLEVLLTSEGTTVRVIGPSGPISAKAEFRFDESDEGAREKASFEEFARTGADVTLSGSHLKEIILPAPIRELIESLGEPDLLKLGSGESARRLDFEMTVEREGAQPFVVPHIEFRTLRAGTESAILSNTGQQIPFQVTVTLSRRGEASIEYRFEFRGSSFLWLSRYVSLTRVARAGAKVTFRDHNTGQQFEARLTADLPNPEIKDEFANLVEKVRKVEAMTRSVIPVPDRDFFTGEDVTTIDRVHSIVAGGVETSPPTEISLSFQPEPGNPDRFKILNGGLDVRLARPQETERVLDTDIELGPVQIEARGMDIHPADRETVRRALEAGLPEIRCRLIKGKDGSIRVTYPAWTKPD